MSSGEATTGPTDLGPTEDPIDDSPPANPAPPTARAPATGLASIARGLGAVRARPLVALGRAALLLGAFGLLFALGAAVSSGWLDPGVGWLAARVAWQVLLVSILAGVGRSAVAAVRPGQPSPAASVRAWWRALVVSGFVSAGEAVLSLPIGAVPGASSAATGQLLTLPVSAAGWVALAAALVVATDMNGTAAGALRGAWALLRGRRIAVLVLGVLSAGIWVASAVALGALAQLARGAFQTAAERDGDFAGTFVAIAIGIAGGAALASVVFWYGLAGACASGADEVALAAARGGPGVRLGDGAGPPREWQAALLLLLPIALSDAGSQEFARSELEALLEPTPGAVSAHAGVVGLILAPAALAAFLLLHDERRRPAVDDEAGFLLGPTDRWPGDRVRWGDLVGFQVREGGLRLRARGAWVGTVVPVGEDALPEIVALLERMGVRRLD